MNAGYGLVHLFYTVRIAGLKFGRRVLPLFEANFTPIDATTRRGRCALHAGVLGHFACGNEPSRLSSLLEC